MANTADASGRIIDGGVDNPEISLSDCRNTRIVVAILRIISGCSANGGIDDSLDGRRGAVAKSDVVSTGVRGVAMRRDGHVMVFQHTGNQSNSTNDLSNCAGTHF